MDTARTSIGTQAAIEVRNLVKRYGIAVAIDDLTLSVRTGEVFTLLGPNGAGKTTTVEILEGYRAPDSGSISVLGLHPIRDARSLRARLGIMLQEGGIYPGIRVTEAIDLFRSYYPDPEEADWLLEVAGLADSSSKKVRILSSGNARRLNFALALTGKPELVFLDEPTAGMDPRARSSLWESIRSLRARGTTVVLTTHLLDEAEALSDRIAIIHRGKLVALGSPDTLTSGTSGMTFRTDAPISTAAASTAVGIPIEQMGAAIYRIEAPSDPRLIAALADYLADQDVLLLEMSSGRSLEQVFLSLTQS